MIGEIESHQPEYLVWVGSANSWAIRSSSAREIFDWFNKYSREYYEITGLAAVRLAGQVIFLWDADARNFHDPVEQSLVIYKRKPSPVIAPAKTD
jgi:hypothetical protein